MSKPFFPLTEQQVIQAEPGEKPRKLFDGAGLYLQIFPSGTKVWHLKFRQSDKRESTLTFGRFPDVSLELARCRRSAARQMLRDGLDPRTEFNANHMGLPKRPVAMDVKQVEHTVDQSTIEAIERLRTIVLPLLCRVPPDEKMRSHMLAMLEKIQNERSAEVIDVLYDVCAEIIFTCLSVGIDDLIDARMAQRRGATQL